MNLLPTLTHAYCGGVFDHPAAAWYIRLSGYETAMRIEVGP